MPAESDIIAARDMTLQKIGRNVVNFQKMEAMLRYILVAANFSVPLAEVHKHLESEKQRIRKYPLGNLTEEAAKVLHSVAKKAPADIDEIWISSSFELGSGGSKLSDWRREMRRVVRERNELIHRMLASWNPNSIDSSRKLCAELDEQRERILSAYNHLESIAVAMRESHQELTQRLDDAVASTLSTRSDGAE
jgi:hypothetical protein